MTRGEFFTTQDQELNIIPLLEYNMEVHSALEEFGLSEKEAKVYLSLLKSGEATGGEVAQECNFHRRTAYDVLDSLLKKGLVSYSMKKYVRVYHAADPKSLLIRLEHRKDLLAAVIPTLESMVQSKEQPVVNVYVGKEGLRTILNDHLSTKKNLLIYGGAMQIVSTLPSIHKKYISERKRLNIKVRGIMVDTPQVRKNLLETPLFEYKFLPPGVSAPVIWWVYGDRVVFVYWREEPFAIQLRSEPFAESFRKYFENTWREETTTYRGLEGIKAILEDTLNYPETLFIGAGGQVSERFGEYLKKEYLPRAIAKGHKWIGVAWPEVRKNWIVKSKISNFRYFSKGIRQPNVVWIYGDKVVNILWTKHPIALMVQNKTLSDTYRQYLKTIWKQAVR